LIDIGIILKQYKIKNLHPNKGRRFDSPRYHPFRPQKHHLQILEKQVCNNGPQLAFYAGATSPITIERLTTVQLHRGGSEASSPLHPAGLHQPPALWKDYCGYYSSSLPFTIYEIIRKLPNPVKGFHENLSFPTSLCSLDYFFIHHSSEARTKFEDIKCLAPNHQSITGSSIPCML
jgi:hypothetical protein